MSNVEWCKDQLVECSQTIEEEIIRWLARSLTLKELDYFHVPKNWKCKYKNTTKGVTNRQFVCNSSSVALRGAVVVFHSGYSIHIHLV